MLIGMATAAVGRLRHRADICRPGAAAITPRHRRLLPERGLTAPAGVFTMAMSIETGKSFFRFRFSLCYFVTLLSS